MRAAGSGGPPSSEAMITFGSFAPPFSNTCTTCSTFVISISTQHDDSARGQRERERRRWKVRREQAMGAGRTIRECVCVAGGVQYLRADDTASRRVQRIFCKVLLPNSSDVQLGRPIEEMQGRHTDTRIDTNQQHIHNRTGSCSIHHRSWRGGRTLPPSMCPSRMGSDCTCCGRLPGRQMGWHSHGRRHQAA